MKRLAIVASMALATVSVAAAPAHATANHMIEQVQKIVHNGKVVGARVHMLVDPDGYRSFRINLGPPRKVRFGSQTNLYRGTLVGAVGRFVQGLKRGNVNIHDSIYDSWHRQTLAGERGSFVKKLKEVSVKGEDAHSTQELYVDIVYDGKIKAGSRVNLLSAYLSRPLAPHIYGAWDGPTIKRDARYVITLPGDDSNVPHATETLVAPTEK